MCSTSRELRFAALSSHISENKMAFDHHQMRVYSDGARYYIIRWSHSHFHLLRSNMKLPDGEGRPTQNIANLIPFPTSSPAMKHNRFFCNSMQRDVIGAFISCTFFSHHYIFKTTGLFCNAAQKGMNEQLTRLAVHSSRRLSSMTRFNGKSCE